jgi:hypothetical protein
MKCWQCFNQVPDFEIYGDWYRCNRCLEDLPKSDSCCKDQELVTQVPEIDAHSQACLD